MNNFCVICGSVIPEGRQVCPICEAKYADGSVCKLCKYDLEDGDYLYQRTSQDHAIVFEEIVVHYCPVCGKKLK